MSDLFDLLQMEALEIKHFFEKASIEGRGTPQEVSDRREVAVRRFLERYFPFPYKVAKGNVIDSYGNRSASIDCLLLSPAHPHTISDSQYSMIFADGVDAAIEVKPALNTVTEIERGLSQIRSIKRLDRVKSGILQHKVTPGEYAASKKIPSFIFSNETYKDIKLLCEKIVDYYVRESVPAAEQFDFIVVNSDLFLLNSRKDSYFKANDEVEGICYLETGDKTLATFLYWLNRLPGSELRISSSVLSHYLPWDVKSLNTFHDLNARLLNAGNAKL